MLLVTGATGVVGREVVARMAATGPVRALVRDPARLTVRGPGLDVATGSYGDRASLLRALDGVTAAFLVTNDPTSPDDDTRFLDVAVTCGVRRVVKLSAYAAGEDDADDLITEWQRQCETALRASGLEWTVLRPRSFMTNTLSWASAVRSRDTVRVLHPTSANACVDPGDIAEVAVRALTEPGHAGCVHRLTGPEALTAEEQTATLAALLGRPLVCRELPLDEALAGWSRRYPAEVARALARSAERQSRGGKTTVAPEFEQITGRGPRSYRRWAADHLEEFR